MKIKVVSDLHLEFADVNIPNDEGCDVLILSGDIMVAQDLHDHPDAPSLWDMPGTQGMGRRQAAAKRYREFLKRVSFQFPHVIYIAGNHEFYHGKWVQALKTLSDECAKFPNIYFLENGYKKIDDVNFVGATLWTDMNKGDPLTLHAARDMLNDFRVIRKEDEGYTTLKPYDTTVRHKDSLKYFSLVMEGKFDEKFVVVGHHTPSYQSCHEMYKHDTLMNACYHSSLEEFILDHPQVKLWTHGHTHHPFDYTIGETRVVCNPRGYEGHEDTGWDINKVIEV